MSFRLDPAEWAEEQFGDCKLGDVRRTKRLIRVAEQVANHPSGSFPEQIPDWVDLKGAYRLFDQDEVTFEAIAGPHWKRTCAVGAGTYLVLGDTTEVNFGYDPDIDGLSRIGNGTGCGFLLHNALLVEAHSKALLGVAGQTIHYRRPAPRKENKSQRVKRERESRVWGDVIEQIGPPPENARFIHVFDRGADYFEIFCRLKQHRNEWVIRASSLHRRILTPDGKEVALKKYLSTLPVAGSYELDLRARPNHPARTATMEVRFGALHAPIPQHTTPYVKQLNPQPIPMWVVWVREVGAPRGKKPIEWVLYTSLPVKTFNDAWQIVEYYECRWLIEEYHKALKSGCSVQCRKLRTADRLEAMVGLMSIVALRLLQLKSVARSNPDCPAHNIVPKIWLTMLKAARKKLRRVHDLTIYQFYRELAKLGGFLGRRSDGEPGWLTIWRGWEQLNTLVKGAELAINLKNCG